MSSFNNANGSVNKFNEAGGSANFMERAFGTPQRGKVASFVDANRVKSCGYSFPAVDGVPGDVLTLLTPITDDGETEWGPGGGAGSVTSVSTTATVVDGVSLTATPNPITGAGSISLGGSVVVNNANWSGTDLSIANGGSGESTAQAAIDSLTDVASAVAGDVLTKSGANAAWVAPAPAGSVTSVSTTATVVDGVSLIATPNPITGAGSISLGGSVVVNNTNWSGTDLSIANGGSGESTAQAAIDSLTDVASAVAGDVLTKSGANAAWVAPVPAGNVTGVAPSVTGNLPQFDNLVADQISDSGVKASEVILNPSGIPVAGGNLAKFDTNAVTLTDSGIDVVDVGDVKSSSVPSVDSRIALYDGVTGKLIKESTVGIDETDLLDVRWKNSLGTLLAPGVGAAALSNCFFGRFAGQNTSTLAVNFQNTSVGVGSFAAASGAWGTTNNTSVGRSNLAQCNGRGNTSVGALALSSLNSTSSFNGNSNCAIGSQCLLNLSTDANLNIAMGVNCGSAYVGNESNNLLIGSNLSGIAAENDTTRLGQGQTRCFIEGITGVQAGPTYNKILINPADGQLSEDTPAYSEQYRQGNTANDTALTVGVWGLLNTTGRVNGPSNEFLQNVGYSSTYVGTPDILAKVNVSVTWENDSTSNIKVQLGVFKNANALPEPNLRCRAHLDDGTDYPRNATLSGFVNLTNGDTLSVQALNETDSDDIIFWSTNFNINKIGLA